MPGSMPPHEAYCGMQVSYNTTTDSGESADSLTISTLHTASMGVAALDVHPRANMVRSELGTRVVRGGTHTQVHNARSCCRRVTTRVWSSRRICRCIQCERDVFRQS